MLFLPLPPGLRVRGAGGEGAKLRVFEAWRFALRTSPGEREGRRTARGDSELRCRSAGAFRAGDPGPVGPAGSRQAKVRAPVTRIGALVRGTPHRSGTRRRPGRRRPRALKEIRCWS